MPTTLSLDEEDFKNILNNMVDGIITINHKGIVLSFNKTAEIMFGYKSEEIIGQNVSILMPQPHSEIHDSYIHNYLTTGIENIIGIGRDVKALRRNNETFPMRLSVIEYPAKIKGDRWFIGSCRDNTLQKKQEELLRRSMKMEAIGKLTSGLAHDYNNVLGIILGYTELLSAQARDQPELLNYIEVISTAAERAANLTQKLLSISRKRTDAADIININDILKSDQQILAKTLTPKIKLSFTFEDNLWPVYIDKGSFEDTILNLSINAMHAMQEGGELSFATSNFSLGALDAQVLQIPAGDYIKLTVTDSGTGMSDELVTHIFEPFFSTKGEKGTGLGLSQVYNFVTEHKGTVQVTSEQGSGTCFLIYLPRYQHEKAANKSAESNDINEGNLSGSENILVVDDERSIRELNENILSSYGYTVFCASNLKEALKILENEAIDLVLSDVIMPEADGFELAHIITRIYPDVKIQLCSGNVNININIKEKSAVNELLVEDILVKPFTARQLLSRIKKLLGNL